MFLELDVGMEERKDRWRGDSNGRRSREEGLSADASKEDAWLPPHQRKNQEYNLRGNIIFIVLGSSGEDAYPVVFG